MTTKLDKALKREIDIDGVAYTVTLSPDGLKIVEKGRRNGPEHTWKDLVQGGATLARDLEDSLTNGQESEEAAGASQR